MKKKTEGELRRCHPEVRHSKLEVLNIEGLGAVTLPRGLIPQNFPRHSFENIALAMKRVYQADIAAKQLSRVAVASAKTVAETMASHLQGDRGQKQAFIESVVTIIINEPSVLLNKLENLANHIWKDRLGDCKISPVISPTEKPYRP